MDYDVDLPTDDHTAEWLGGYGDDGALQFCCDASDDPGCLLISAGWAHIHTCPVCGSAVDLSTEER